MTSLRWVFIRHWHPEARWYARWRALWLVVTGWETEICGRCGGKVGLVWRAPDDLWQRASGYPTDGGVLCLRCFDSRAHLYWECAEGDYPSCIGSPCAHQESMMVVATQRDRLWRDGCEPHPAALVSAENGQT